MKIRLFFTIFNIFYNYFYLYFYNSLYDIKIIYNFFVSIILYNLHHDYKYEERSNCTNTTITQLNPITS
jgi:hypothetical protein